ncbi:Cadherin-13 [Fukomys damarensis]|uniref:Cadherin-13 n=1 Tax=Fukomys damarensis TaxID=885580 RepID=A0A091DZA3_FUKDA|nr:Cadherin-13 [Fukomys damarensis]
MSSPSLGQVQSTFLEINYSTYLQNVIFNTYLAQTVLEANGKCRPLGPHCLGLPGRATSQLGSWDDQQGWAQLLFVKQADDTSLRWMWEDGDCTAPSPPCGTTVMRMTAFDADDPATDNALLRYNIRQQTPDKPSPNMFYIDPEKGDIVTVVSPALLDRETLENPKYELIIEAQDMAGLDVGLTGTATATIVIDDKNDHSPKFTKKERDMCILDSRTAREGVTASGEALVATMRCEPGSRVVTEPPSSGPRERYWFQATVEEGAAGVIVNLTVEDKDDPTTGAWRAAYTIINGNPGQSFEIHTNPQTNEGMLSVVKPLDYEISAFHTLLIKVENEDPLVPDVSYGPSSTATVHITVLDVNEGPVFYPDPMMVTKWENISVGSVLLTVNATDPDSLQHQTIRYSVYKDPAGWLNINPINGTVDTTAVLDRESPFVRNSVYTALFLAVDSGDPPATGTGTLLITLEDVNDNAPFIYPTVAEVCDDAKNLSVVILGASDKDLHPNTDPFKFEIHKQTVPDKVWKITKINNTHALVSLLQNLNKANYNLPIMVTDSGKPPMTNVTDLRVQVCSCRNSRVDCNTAGALHFSLTSLVLLVLSSLVLQLMVGDFAANLGTGEMAETERRVVRTLAAPPVRNVNYDPHNALRSREWPESSREAAARGVDADKRKCLCTLSLTSPLDDMSSRIDDLEKNIADLMTQAGMEELEGENKIPATQKS